MTDMLVLDNFGPITGTGTGIATENSDATIINNANSLIQGGRRGLEIDGDLDLITDGTIQSTTQEAVFVSNAGTARITAGEGSIIRGATDGLAVEGNLLNERHAKQEPIIQQSQKMRAQLDSIAQKTALLAALGNPNATLLVQELRKRGININRLGQTAAAATKGIP